MKHNLLTWNLFLAFLCFGFFSCKQDLQKQSYNQGISIIPQPEQLQSTEGNFKLTPKTTIQIQEGNEELKRLAAFLNTKIKLATGFELAISDKETTKQSIVFEIEAKERTSPEAYDLFVTKDNIRINATAANGIFYGIQSLLQLLPAEIVKNNKIEANWIIPSVNISDSPRFKWRGMHLDVCRHFFSVEQIKKHLDLMASYKLNTFHWHLTEDQGWRIEIKKYPKLTEHGSKRYDGEGNEYGGFYTQEEVKEIVAYAAERFINVVPEIEMPGHSLGAISAYPEFACEEGPFKVRNTWGIEPDVYCAGKEETFEFLQNVIDEVIELFPYTYFHVGGDECPKDRWKTCKACQARIKAESLKDEHELQSYFIQRMERYLASKGKKLIGWDEILEGGLAPNAAVMSWRGESGGIASAKMKHYVIMSPNSDCYYDHYQGDRYAEPLNIGGYTSLEEAYAYDPVPEELTKEEQKYILGAQANVWTEFMPNWEFVEYMTYPRMLALSEVVWNTKENKDWNAFIKKLDKHHMRLTYQDVNFHIPLPDGNYERMRFIDSISLEFKTTRPEVKMHYTTDGSEPNAKSKTYEKALSFNKNTVLKIRSILPTGQMSKVREVLIEKMDYSPAIEIEESKTGLIKKYTPGYFSKVDDLSKVEIWEESVVNLSEIKYDEKVFEANIFEGYFNVNEDDVYTFQAQVSQLIIDDEIIIDTQGKSKRVVHPIQKALKKGTHKIKIIFLQNVEKGVASAWYRPTVKIKSSKEKEFRKIQDDEFFHQ